ncbi:MAG: septal ring lytic transglycosylase RlpA family protein [Acidobacteriota bacterium]|nr:septal ring lytic transglycosylase RlpA family protein [Acidobacteriota bacterium]
MVIRRILRNLNLNTAFRIWLVAGVSSVALAAVVVTLCTRTVLADALLSGPAATTSTAAPVESATPASLASQSTGSERWAGQLHGVASWYGGVFDGRRTASGERFDMYAMTACHPTLPFGTLVRVVDHSNHRSVVVRITDRGELYQGRIIDLSYAAAQKLAMIKPGLARVDLQILSLGRTDASK